MIFDQITPFKRAIKGLCVLFALLSVALLSRENNFPAFRIDIPVKDLVAGKYTSKLPLLLVRARLLVLARSRLPGMVDHGLFGGK